jgi:predicted membrane-bound spermidine synthase
MGGTLPVMVRAVSPNANGIGARGGGLYAANTTGAVLGSLLASFLLIPVLGIKGSAFAAASVNLLVALAAAGLFRSAALPAPKQPVKGTFNAKTKLAIAIYAVAGGIALGYEVVWSQSIAQFMSTRAFAFSVMLATYLFGLALGAAVFARFADRVRDPWSAFGLLIASAGVVALLQIGFLGHWIVTVQSFAEYWALRITGSEFVGMCARFQVAALAMVFLPTLLLGAAFPAVLRLAVPTEHVGAGVGIVTAINTIGGIAGSIATGFLLVPGLGLVRTLGVLAVAAAATGAVAAFASQAPNSWGRRASAALATAALVAAVLIPASRLATLLPGARAGHLVFYEEGLGATVAVVEQGEEARKFRRLYIQGVSNTGDSLPSLRYMRLQALLPLIIHNGEPRSALVVGLGTGITAGALLDYAGLERRVAAELLPAVVEATSLFAGNNDASRDTRLDVRLRDGRRELLTSTDRYDLITLEPPPPSAAGVANLYSTDFYKLAAARLQPGGIVAQWLPLPTQNFEDTQSLVRSFIDVFPHVSLWTTELHEMLLIGSRDPIRLDLAKLTPRFNEPDVKAALAEVGIASPAALLSLWVTDRDGLVRFAGDAPSVTDDRPRIEYAPWVKRDAFVETLVALFALRQDVPVENASADFWAQFHGERDLLDKFYQAGIYAYIGDRAGWQAEMTKVQAAGPDNPYYRWVFGERRGG